jgi:hypothetical protein
MQATPPAASDALAVFFLFERAFARRRNPRKLKTATDHAAAEFALLVRVPEKDGVRNSRDRIQRM